VLLSGCAGNLTARTLKAGRASTVGMDPERLAALDEVITREIETGTIPGAVLLIARSGTIVYSGAWGARALDPVPEEMSFDTIFDLASMTKPLATAAAVMRLVELGQVRLQDRVSVYLPEFAGGGKGGIRVAHLLTHTSGLPPGVPVSTLRSAYGAYSPEAVWWWICAHDPEGEPGMSFIYSDINYHTLARLVRRVSGRTLADFCRAEIYEPLGMTDTGFYPEGSRLARVAPTERVAEGVLRGQVHDPMSRLVGGEGGSAGLFSTASDIARFCQMLLNGGSYDGTRIFSPLTIRAMTQDRIMGRGYGFDVASPYATIRGDLLGPDSFGHSGYTGTSVWIDPEQDLFVILLTNRVHPDDSGSVVPLRSKVSNVVAAALTGPPPGRR